MVVALLMNMLFSAPATLISQNEYNAFWGATVTKVTETHITLTTATGRPYSYKITGIGEMSRLKNTRHSYILDMVYVILHVHTKFNAVVFFNRITGETFIFYKGYAFSYTL